MDEATQVQFDMLLLKLIDGDINEEEVEQVETSLQNSPELRRRYREFMRYYLLTRKSVHAISIDENAPFFQKRFREQVWTELARHERNAPELVVEASRPDETPLQPRNHENVHRRFHQVSLVLSIASIAALFLIVVTAMLIVPRQEHRCAVLVDSFNARWVADSTPLASGDVLYNSEQGYTLTSGIVRIRFDYGAEVIIEGPASFHCQTGESLSLHQGRLSAFVPLMASGFSVDTPTSKIVDLGTEFGVEVVSNRATEVHMLKGKAALIPGSRGQKQASVSLEAGQAACVDNAGRIENIPFENDRFVRRVSSRNGFVWRGEEISVTDGLIIHLKADALSLEDGDPVTFWPDSASNDLANGAVSALSGFDAPTFKASAYHGMPAVRFTRPKDAANAPDSQKQVLVSDPWNWDASQGVTIFILCTGGLPAYPQRVVQVGRAGEDLFESLSCDVSAGESGVRFNDGNSLTTSPFRYGDWHVSMRQVAQGARYKNSWYAVDDLPARPMTSNQGNRTISFFETDNTVTVGNGGWHLADWPYLDWYDGYVAEILVYNRQLTSAEKQSVLKYLFAKYGHTPHDSTTATDLIPPYRRDN